MLTTRGLYGDKVWISLFTCSVVWAVHLEFVPDLTAEAFIRCLRRFSARCGIPLKIVSNNSKTLAKLSHDELFLVEVEATINSRPISYLSSEDVDEPLTPSHLLVGHRLLNLPDSMNCETDPDFGTNSDRIGMTQHMTYFQKQNSGTLLEEMEG